MTGLVDLDRARLLDVVDGRAGSAVAEWLSDRDRPWSAAVERVALDPYRGYYNALVGGLDAPEVVVDAFHIVRLGNTVVDEVRRRVQQQTLGHRGHAGDPLYGIRRLLLTGYERLSDRGRARMHAGLAAGDPHDEVWYAHVVKEQLRAVYRAGDLDAARVALTSSTTSPLPLAHPSVIGSPAPSAGGNQPCSRTTEPTGCPTRGPRRSTTS